MLDPFFFARLLVRLVFRDAIMSTRAPRRLECLAVGGVTNLVALAAPTPRGVAWPKAGHAVRGVVNRRIASLSLQVALHALHHVLGHDAGTRREPSHGPARPARLGCELRGPAAGGALQVLKYVWVKVPLRAQCGRR